MAEVAYTDLGVIGPGLTMSASQSAAALVRANRMIKSWSVQYGTVPYIAREVFDATVGKGSPTNPYTIGPGGDFDTTRPNTILGFGELQNSGLTTEVEIPRGILTPESWEAIQVKRITNSLATDLYYQPTYSGGLGAIYIWPVQSTTDYKIVLYFYKPLGEFANVSTDYDLPPAAEEAIQYNLAERLIPAFQVPEVTAQRVRAMARWSLANYKRSNARMMDLATDPALTQNNRWAYNIVTGTGG